MAEYSRLFGGPAGSVPEYNQNEFAEVLEKIFSNGVFTDITNALEVTETDPVSLAVSVNTGEAWINGFWYQNTAALTKALSAADATNDRIDRIVLRLDTVTNFKISVEVLEGTAAASPAAPALTQTASTYEISLAQVLVEATVTSVADAKITDERTYVAANEAQAKLSAGLLDKTRPAYLMAASAVIPATNGADQKQVDGTNKSYYVLGYDKDTGEHAYWHFPVPDWYDGGNVVFNVYCKSAATTGNVVFVIATGDVADGATFDAALGTTITFTAKDVDGTAGDMFIASKTADPGWTVGRMATIKLSRDVSEDNAAQDVDVLVLEMKLEVT